MALSKAPEKYLGLPAALPAPAQAPAVSQAPVATIKAAIREEFIRFMLEGIDDFVLNKNNVLEVEFPPHIAGKIDERTAGIIKRIVDLRHLVVVEQSAGRMVLLKYATYMQLTQHIDSFITNRGSTAVTLTLGDNSCLIDWLRQLSTNLSLSMVVNGQNPRQIQVILRKKPGVR
ncbi:MAG: hypothetical protein WC843_05860 [Candidatus Gracilibacteria bacterium]|jgi:hypothetical protein